MSIQTVTTQSPAQTPLADTLEPTRRSQPFNAIFRIAVNTSSAALAAYAFGIMDPLGGAVFGASTAVVSLAFDKIAEELGITSTVAKAIVKFFTLILCLAISIGVTALAGFHITLGAVVGMRFAMIATRFAMGCALGCTACAGGAALALADRRA